MPKIVIKDLEMSKALDNKALSCIFGGLYNKTFNEDRRLKTECVGTFLVNGELKQRFRDIWQRVTIVIEDYEKRTYDRSFISPAVTCT